MAEIGDGESKPWSRETCRRRYVEGAAIGLRPLSALSGVNIASLRGWSQRDKTDPEHRSWPAQREQWIHDIRSRANEKSAQALSDKYAEQNNRALEQHIELSEKLRGMAGVFLSAASTKINSITSPDKVSSESLAKADKLIVMFKDIGGRVPLQICANILGQAVGLERQARYMDLADPAVLEKAAARQGLSLVDLEAEQNDE
jgi:hypothetical protein